MKKSAWRRIVAVGIVLVVGMLGAAAAEAQDHDPCNFYEDSTFRGRSCAGTGRGCMECVFDIDGHLITIYAYSPTNAPSAPPPLGLELAAAPELPNFDGDWGVSTDQSVQVVRSCAEDGRVFDVLDPRRHEKAVSPSPARGRARRHSDPVAAP